MTTPALPRGTSGSATSTSVGSTSARSTRSYPERSCRRSRITRRSWSRTPGLFNDLDARGRTSDGDDRRPRSGRKCCALDIQPVFDRIVDHARRLCDDTIAAVSVLGDSGVSTRSLAGPDGVRSTLATPRRGSWQPRPTRHRRRRGSTIPARCSTSGGLGGGARGPVPELSSATEPGPHDARASDATPGRGGRCGDVHAW